MHGRRIAAATVATVLAVASGASAFAPGTTTLLDRPDGQAALPAAGLTESFTFRESDMSPDGRWVVFVSGADGLSTTDDDRETALWLRDRTLNVTTRISTIVTDPVTPSASPAFLRPGVSDDGDRICFATDAALDPVNDTDTFSDVYVKDMSEESVTLVSRATDGGNGTPAGPAYECAISGDGAHVAFTTTSGFDAVHSGGSNQVYRRTLASSTTQLVSRADTATGARATSASAADMSSDGDVVVFTASGSLESGDSNSHLDVYARRISTADTRLVSTADGSGTPGTAHSFRGTVSADGDDVAFNSGASLASGAGTFSGTRIFRKRLSTNATVLVSRADGAAGDVANASADSAAISADGHSVAFSTAASNLDPGVSDGNGLGDVYVRRDIDGANPTTTLASRATSGALGDRASTSRAIGGTGDLVLFDSASLGFSSELDFKQLFVRKLSAPAETRAVIRPTGDALTFPSNQGFSTLPGRGRAISDDGRYVVFTSGADMLLGGASDLYGRGTQAYVRDTVTHTTTMLSRAPNGAPGLGDTVAVAISADGSRAAFQTQAQNLSNGISGPATNLIYVRDLASGTLTLASLADDDTVLDGDAFEPVLDADGSRVAFSTVATNMANGDSDAQRDVHVRDLSTGATLLVSRATGAAGAKAGQPASNPAISADGNRVAFETNADNLGDGDADFFTDVHARDLAAGTTVWASRPDGTGVTPANGNSSRASISADGNLVAFQSEGDNLGDGDTDLTSDIHVRDLVANTTRLVSRAAGAAGAKGNSASGNAQMSSDGKSVVFMSGATNLLAVPDMDQFDQVFLRRLDTNDTIKVSRSNNGDIFGTPFEAFVNGDGSCVAFDGFANPLPPDGASPDFPHVYLRTLSKDCNRPEPPPDTGNNGGGGGNNGAGGGSGGGGSGGSGAGGSGGATTPPGAPPRGPAAPALARLDPKRTFSVPRTCRSRRRLRIGLRLPVGARVTSVAATLNAKRARTTRRGTNVDLAGLPRGRVRVTITIRLADGRSATLTKTYRTCSPPRRRARRA